VGPQWVSLESGRDLEEMGVYGLGSKDGTLGLGFGIDIP
jgi:hypothetical protein